MKKRRRLSRLFECTILGINLHTIFEIICSIGFLIQSTLVLINYFSFPELTNVSLIVPEVTPLPDVVICFDGAYIINWTKVFIQYQQFKSTFHLPNNLNIANEIALRRYLFSIWDKNQLMMILARSLTISQLVSLMYTNSELVTSLSITNLTVNQSKDFCKIDKVLRSLRICYIFHCSLKGPVTLSNEESAKAFISPNILTINMNQSIFNFAPNFFITLVPPSYKPRGNSLRWDTMSIVYNEPLVYRMHYFTFERKLLPSPYQSNCIDYIPLGYRRAIDMKDVCFNNKSIEYFGVPFHASMIDVDLNVPLGLVKYTDNVDNRTFRQQLNFIVDHCFQLTERPDCYEKIFFIRPRNPIPTSGNKSVISFGTIKEPNIKVIVEPRLVLIDVIIAIGSISGTWFGFSIIEHVPKIYRSSWYKVSSWVRFQAGEKRTEKVVVREFQRRASKRLESIPQLNQLPTINSYHRNRYKY